MEWIPVKEKLPKRYGHYLVCFDDGFVTGADFEDDWELWADSGEVVAWMELPEPYKEEEEVDFVIVGNPNLSEEDYNAIRKYANEIIKKARD